MLQGSWNLLTLNICDESEWEEEVGLGNSYCLLYLLFSFDVDTQTRGPLFKSPIIEKEVTYLVSLWNMYNA